MKKLTQGLLILAVASIFVTQSVNAQTQVSSTELSRLYEVAKLLQAQVAAIKSSPGAVLGARVVVVKNDTELFTALSTAQGGDTIQLQPGTYGEIIIQIPYNRLVVGSTTKQKAAVNPASTVIVTSANRSNPAVIQGITLNGAENWRFEHVAVRPEKRRPAINMGGKNNAIMHSHISFGDKPRQWSEQEWKDKAGTAVQITGDNIEVGYNTMTAISFGVGVLYSAQYANIHHNSIVDFHGDGIRISGDFTRVEHNYIANVYKIDGNHDDGIQGWSYDPVTSKAGGLILRGAVIRHNTIINSLEPHPLRGQMQGIGMFDGPYADFVVENNLVLVDHYHGISLGDPHDTVIRNNVVIDQDDTNKAGPLWISASEGKDKIASGGPKNVTISNNIANRYLGTSLVGNTFSNNATMTTATAKTQLFVNFDKYDFRIKPGALAFTVGPDAAATSVPPVPTTPVTIPTTPGATSTIDTSTPDSNDEDEESEISKPALIVSGIRTSTKVTGTINFTITPRNFPGITRMEYRINKGDWVTTAAPYSVSFDTKTVSNGPLSISLRGTNSVGQTVQRTIKVTVDNSVSGSSTPAANPVFENVQTTSVVNVRLNPNGKLVGVRSLNSTGVADMSTVQTAGGIEWVYVKFNLAAHNSGYVARSYLAPVKSASTTSPTPPALATGMPANFGSLSKEQKIAILLDLLGKLQQQLLQLQKAR